MDPALMHRVAVIGAGTLDSLPHNGAVVTLARRLRIDAQGKLLRHRDGRHRRRDARARGGDRARLCLRFVLEVIRSGAAPCELSLSSLSCCLPAAACLPRNGVPADLMQASVIPGMPDVRAPAGRISAEMTKDLAQSFKQESPNDFPVGADGYVHYAHLALSGGGANGAFGAGLLNGWTKVGSARCSRSSPAYRPAR